MREYYDNCCSLPEVVTLAGKKMNVDELINLLRSGKLDGKIYDETYFNTADQLKEAVSGAFPDTEWSDGQNTLWAKLTHNIYTFSGAKNYNELLAYRAAMMDNDGNLVSYEKFRQRVTRIGEEFNDHYLRTEYNSAARFAEMAEKWDYLKKFNVLEYRTVQDDKVRESHEKLHGKRFKTDDPIWDVIYPPNDWGCRCTVISAQGKPVDDPKSISANISKDVIKPYFRRNIGKEQIIFDDNHPFLKGKRKQLTAVNYYGMRTSVEIFRDKEALPGIRFFTKREQAQSWFNAIKEKPIKAIDGVSVMLDKYFERKIVKKGKLKYKDRFMYAHTSVDVLQTADEVWSTNNGGKIQNTYIKYFKDGAYVFVLLEKTGKMIFKTFFKSETRQGLEDLRKGVLKHRK